MAEADQLQLLLLRAQNADGGWGYENGSSWTEPTALALLALEARQARNYAFERGCAWLIRNQRGDGGWPPKPSVNVTTWVTSLATLALSGTDGAAIPCRRGIHWLVSEIQPQGTAAVTNYLLRAIFRMRGISPPLQGGSPWFPGTAAWVAPTAMSILALSAFVHTDPQEKLASHIQNAQQYLLSRRCRDGGWNHGGSPYRSENANSYPETTGLALLALYHQPALELNVSLNCARSLLRCPGSIEALSSLQLGLMRHGIDVVDIKTALECRTTRDVSLRLLALTARSETNKLLLRT